MSNLYDLSKAQELLLEEMLNADTDEARGEYIRLYNELEEDKDAKIAGLCALIKNKQALAQMYFDEAQKLRDKYVTLDGSVETLKAYLKKWVPEKEKWRHGVHSIGWRKSTKLFIDAKAPVPSQFKKIREEIDTDAVREHLDGGGTLDFASYVESQNIQVK